MSDRAVIFASLISMRDLMTSVLPCPLLQSSTKTASVTYSASSTDRLPRTLVRVYLGCNMNYRRKYYHIPFANLSETALKPSGRRQVHARFARYQLTLSEMRPCQPEVTCNLQFSSHKDFMPRNTALFDGLSDFLFVSVRVGSVNMPISQL